MSNDKQSKNVLEESQELCQNCKGSGHVLIGNHKTEICEVCEGKGIKPDGK